MQIDFHYYATFCIARSAGLNLETATRIATAAQFVDDNTAIHGEGDDATIATAHSVSDLDNRDKQDQKSVWLPFHFVPGNTDFDGNPTTDLHTQLVCRTDSKIINEAFDNHLQQEMKYLPELVGIISHAFADTFAHYGFIGMSSNLNLVDGNSFILSHPDDIMQMALGKNIGDWFAKWGVTNALLKNVVTGVSEFSEWYSGALGHGGVATYPDMPFLKWSYTYETGRTVEHNNPTTYLLYANKIFHKFKSMLNMYPDLHRTSNIVPWGVLEPRVKWVISQVGDSTQRSIFWQQLSEQGKFGIKETIPNYSEDDNKLFHDAAKYHKNYILKELLPNHNINF